MKELTSYNAKFFVAALLLLCGIFLWQGEAWAAPPDCVTRPPIPIRNWDGSVTNMTTNPSGGAPFTRYEDDAPPLAFAVFTHPLVGCMEDMIVFFGMSGFAAFRDSVKATVVAVLTLYLIVMSYKTMFNAFEKSHAAEFSIVVLKFSAVAFFVIYGGVEYFMPSFYGFMQGLTNVITATIPGNPACNYTRLWIRIDCNIGHIVAADIIGGGGIQSPWALFSIAGQMLWTPEGMVLIVLIGIMVVCLGAAFATACMTYIMCIIALTVLMMISPIVIPTILFNSTKTIFENWFRLLVGYTLMPMILFGYLAFCLQIYNYVIDPPGATLNSIIGMKHVAQDIVNTINDPNYLSHRTVVEGQMRVENPGAAPPIPDPAAGHHSEIEGWSFVVTNHNFNNADLNICLPINGGVAAEYRSCRAKHMILNLLMLALMMVLTLSFMSNVMEKSGELVGTGVSATFMNNINYYKMAVDTAKNMTKDATAAAVSGGADLSMKNTSAGTLSNLSKM